MSFSVFVSNSVGCESTSAEGVRVIRYLEMNRHVIVADVARADYVIVNTCAFVEFQRRQVMEKLDEISAAAPAAKLIVMGCAGEIAPELLSKHSVELVCGHYDLDRLDAIFAETIRFDELPAYSQHLTLPNIVIVACRGCVGTCTYCSIRRSTGKIKSRPVPEILADMRHAMKEGHREFFLTGDDLGSYGLDLGQDLPTLLNALLQADLDIKVLLGNINPRWINEYIDDLVTFFESDVARRWIFFPIQSANNDVLSAMGRRYTIESCVESIERLQKVDRMKFYYDLIVGFPTETESAFMDTLNFVLRYPPSHGMIARFSRESGTPAADLEPLPKEVARDRHQRLAEVYSAAQGVLIRQDPSLVRIFGT